MTNSAPNRDRISTGSDMRPEPALIVSQRSSPAPIGRLEDAVPDTMTLHTRLAYVLFTGRPADTTRNAPGIPGGRRFAAISRTLWQLSANDNPYADWILIQLYDELLRIRCHLSEMIGVRESEIESLKRRGLSLSVLSSRQPMTLDLGFRSPYGYATAEAMVEFDYYARIVRTLVAKDRLSDAQGDAAIKAVGKSLRGLFTAPIRWERHLLHEQLRPLSRSDFLPGADESARKRVRAATALFGEVSRAVFTGAEVPRHTQRRVRLSEAELRLLQVAPLSLDETRVQSEAELL